MITQQGEKGGEKKGKKTLGLEISALARQQCGPRAKGSVSPRGYNSANFAPAYAGQNLAHQILLELNAQHK